MISFFTADVTYQVRSRTGLRQWLNAVAKAESMVIRSVSIILCSDEYLYGMNVRYLQHKTYTDIITFDQGSTTREINGELYISIDRVRDNAKTLGLPIREELHRVMVHGLLHLCGYGDKTMAAKKKMTQKEDEYLGKRRFR